jgi:1-acyl-sn-glycerol-3-phosphate acyltransferase
MTNAAIARPRAGELWLWKVLFPPARALALFLIPVRVVGRENLPRTGPYLLVSNHISWVDPPWLEFVVARPIRYLAKRELFSVPVFGWLIMQAGVFALERDSADRAALRKALAFLAAGEVVGIFPEGHRSRDRGLLRARPGVALLARRSGVPVVPVAFEGTDVAKLGRFWRRDVTLHFGTPFYARDLAGEDEQALTDQIMRRIAAMLPPERRGVYA